MLQRHSTPTPPILLIIILGLVLLGAVGWAIS